MVVQSCMKGIPVKKRILHHQKMDDFEYYAYNTCGKELIILLECGETLKNSCNQQIS